MAEKVLLGLSGGVDSAVAAHLLQEAGYEVTGAFFSFFPEADPSGARDVAAQLGISLVEEEHIGRFHDCVISDFIENYKAGKTPNPCARCNRTVKIEVLYRAAEKYGIPRIATGHYARVTCDNGRFGICEGVDKGKDQSYFLWQLSQEQLSRLLLPLGGYMKKDLKAFAEKEGYVCAKKKESQEICFIPNDDYVAFLEQNADFPAESVWKTGRFVDVKGREIGRHKGIVRYTVGQRRGLGVAMGERCFVQSIDPVSGDIVLATESPLRTAFDIDSPMFLSMAPQTGELICHVRTRYRAKPVECRVNIQKDGAFVETAEPTLVCPGQSAVFYDGEAVLFGGVCR